MVATETLHREMHRRVLFDQNEQAILAFSSVPKKLSPR
jgi:hypothetical protein